MASEKRGPGQPAAAFFSPSFFDCVRAGFLDEGGGQAACERLWRLIRSI
jgi:hypothetical protein